MVKLVTHQVVAGRPSHVAGWPQVPASTNFWHQILYYNLLESVTMKPTHEWLQSGPTVQGVLPIGHPLGPLVSGLCTLPPHVRYIPRVTLILVEF
jgi:hypothetical protein